MEASTQGWKLVETTKGKEAGEGYEGENISSNDEMLMEVGRLQRLEVEIMAATSMRGLVTAI